MARTGLEIEVKKVLVIDRKSCILEKKISRNEKNYRPFVRYDGMKRKLRKKKFRQASVAHNYAVTVTNRYYRRYWSDLTHKRAVDENQTD